MLHSFHNLMFEISKGIKTYIVCSYESNGKATQANPAAFILLSDSTHSSNLMKRTECYPSSPFLCYHLQHSEWL